MLPDEIEKLRSANRTLKEFERWVDEETSPGEMKYEEHRLAVEQLRYELEKVTDSLYKHIHEDDMQGIQHSVVIDIMERQQERLKKRDGVDGDEYLPEELYDELDEVEEWDDEGGNVRDILERHDVDEERKREILDRYLPDSDE